MFKALSFRIFQSDGECRNFFIDRIHAQAEGGLGGNWFS